MKLTRSDTIGHIVARNVHAAAVFNYYGVDYYVHGKRTLERACLEERAPIAEIMDQLFELKDEDDSREFLTMHLHALSTYILRHHHKFTERKIVFIRKNLERLTFHHGEPDPRLTALKKTFNELAVYLTVHMNHEEFIIFPFIDKMVKSGRPHENIKSPIGSMISDHEYEALALKKLASLTNNYTAPAGADYPLKMTYAAIKELQEDLKVHMHLENNILFPRAVDFATTTESMVQYNDR